jgi:hypothetical protein
LWLYGPSLFVVRILNVIYFFIGMSFFYKALSKEQPLAVLMIFFRRGKIFFSACDLFCVVIGLCNFMVFSSHTEAVPRYYLSFVPFIIYPLARVCIYDRINIIVRGIFASLILLPPLFIGEPDSTRIDLFHGFSGPENTLNYPRFLELHKEAVLAVKSALKENETLLTNWLFVEILKSDYAGYGPNVAFKIIDDPAELKSPPDAILWTNYPEQLSHDAVDKFTAAQNYQQTVFELPPIKIVFYLRKPDVR